ncbi:MAG: glycine--tRNA ligase subunit beta [Mariprofundaceae bacterium]|nr:glycine--tRNA ligase subunit beta [Mariprofundaceae bacterium]
MSFQPLLIEIGVEEIPAGVAPSMGNALKAAVETVLKKNHVSIEATQLRLGVTPRRLLLSLAQCPTLQADREEVLWGPPERVAFKEGEATKAAEGFARKTGLDVSDFSLADKGDGKNRYMKAVRTVKGQSVIAILAQALPDILNKLPSPKRMQWQDGDLRPSAFIRPIRWIVARLGEALIPFSFAGIPSGKVSKGHRIHGSQGELNIHNPFAWLESQCVLVDREQRKALIVSQLATAASDVGVQLVEDAALLDEVTDLVEWPSVITGRYEENFLRLPSEVSRIELKHHQRCFSTSTGDGSRSPVFFTVANIVSSNPALVAQGNERVVNARLADAAFYFDRDPEESLEARVAKLSHVVFQEGLGMVGDQVRRLRGFVLDNANSIGADTSSSQRAAYLCKSDLSTGLVYEFPELQGYMGGIYAKIDGESDLVANAIAQHYKPESAEGDLPTCAQARIISIAERTDKLLGYFHLGRIPSASADPFALRRAAIALIRLLIASDMPVNLSVQQLLEEGSKQWNQQRVTVSIEDKTRQAVHAFIHERFLAMADSLNVSRPALEASLAATTPRTLAQQLEVARLLSDFADSEVGVAVAAANKRIANILKKNPSASHDIKPEWINLQAERELWTALVQAQSAVKADQPKEALAALALLRPAVDNFFDDVMVMDENLDVRQNRLAMLQQLRALFLQLADVSLLS